jgi:hypothetical protein
MPSLPEAERRWVTYESHNGRSARQPDSEHRALAVLAGDGHVPAHHAGELAGDGEAQPGAAVRFSF